jgi:hypothetical protein
VSNKRFHIPKHGGAGPAFLGVEFKDTYIVLLSIFIALPAGRIFGGLAYVAIPLGGYFLNKQYLEWKEMRLPGFFRSVLFRWGISGYSAALSSKDVIFVGDGKVINPGRKKLPVNPEGGE